MASPLSILKNVLNLNHNCMHITSFEQKTISIHRYGETYEQTRIYIHARPYKRVQKLCPVCRKKCSGYDTKYNTESLWRAPNLNGVLVYICYQPKRIECPEHGVRTEYIPWADGRSRFTKEFSDEVAWMVCRMSKTAVALFEDIDWRTVGNCVKAAHNRIEPDITVRMHNLRRICVDETAYRKGYAYITVVYDMDRNRVVWIHEGNGLEIFRLFCEALSPEERAKIEIVAGDGAQWMPDLAEARAIVKAGDYDTLQLLYDDIPDTLSQLIRTAFVPRPGYKFIVSDFSAIEARVLAYLAGEAWRSKVFAEGKDIYCASASQMFGVPVEKHGINGHLRQKGKIAELALGYGGSVGALKSMGALEMGLTEEELQPLVNSWRNSNPMVTAFWWDIDRAVKTTITQRIQTEVRGIRFFYKSGMLFIKLPSGRLLSYVKPRIGENQYGGESVTYEGVGSTKKWERIESYGPKFVENIVQAVSRDILCYAMKTLRHCFIVGHVHDELIIECRPNVDLNVVCKQMGRSPDWMPDILLRADGYETNFYKKTDTKIAACRFIAGEPLYCL